MGTPVCLFVCLFVFNLPGESNYSEKKYENLH